MWKNLFTVKNITLAISFILNLLGGTGLIDPPVDLASPVQIAE